MGSMIRSLMNSEKRRVWRRFNRSEIISDISSKELNKIKKSKLPNWLYSTDEYTERMYDFGVFLSSVEGTTSSEAKRKTVLYKAKNSSRLTNVLTGHIKGYLRSQKQSD